MCVVENIKKTDIDLNKKKNFVILSALILR